MRALLSYNDTHYTDREYTQGNHSVYLTIGTFEVEMYGAGGGYYNWNYDKAWGNNGGGSGAGFKGIINITEEGTYNISVGTFNGRATNGGATTFGSLISCGGGGYDTHGYGSNPKGFCIGYGDGGTLTIDESIIVSYDIKSDGNSGSYNSHDGGPGYWSSDGGKSLYDDSSTGYGAGQYSGYNTSNYGAGYFKITAITGEILNRRYIIQTIG